MAEAKRDQNRVTTLTGVSSIDGETPINVTVTDGKLDVNASIDTTGLALDATLTGGSQKSQIVDAGGEAVTVTGGKLDVNASIDTTGLALAANQLPDGHNVTVDNASIAVTNAGITTIAGAVAGTEMQVDVLTMPTVTVKDDSASSTTVTQVASSASNVTLKASNASRKMLIIVNDSTAILYVKLGATASSTSYSYKLSAGDTLELPHPTYTGAVDGIWASANGNAYVTEY